MKLKSLALALLAMAGALSAHGRAHAQFVVVDPANLAQSILQVTHMVEQVANQVRQVEQAAAMLAASPLNLSPDLSRSLDQTTALFRAVEGLSFQAERLSDELRALYPETWSAYNLEAALAQSQHWRSQSRRALETAMAAHAQAARAMSETNGQIERALSASAGAEGQTSAIQASNQLLGVQAGQLQHITALLTAQARALETERAERIARQERARHIQERAFPTAPSQAPAPARSAFD